MYIRILFTDGYEIDILGDPTREAHGTNKRHRGTASCKYQVRFVAAFAFSPDVKAPEMRNRSPRMLEKLLISIVRWVALIIFNRVNCFSVKAPWISLFYETSLYNF